MHMQSIEVSYIEVCAHQVEGVALHVCVYVRCGIHMSCSPCAYLISAAVGGACTFAAVEGKEMYQLRNK